MHAPAKTNQKYGNKQVMTLAQSSLITTKSKMIICWLSTGKNVLSNFSTADINVNFGTHTSAKHAFQLTKALRNGVFHAAERIRSVSTALDAKRIEDTFRRNLTWET